MDKALEFRRALLNSDEAETKDFTRRMWGQALPDGILVLVAYKRRQGEIHDMPKHFFWDGKKYKIDRRG